MKIATGRVIEGKIVVEGEPLPEGSVVTVLARDDEFGFDLSPEEESELLAAVSAADLGELVSWEEVREQLRHIR